MEMTRIEFDKLVKAVSLGVVRELERRRLLTDGSGEHWVTTKRAAELLGIKPDRMREIKDRFPHTKQGSNGQGRLLFLREGLMKGYTQCRES